METVLFNECWRDIKEYKGLYSVSSHGRIKNSIGKGLQPYYSQGYKKVKLSKNGKRTSYFIARLVARAFIGELHDHEVDHINRDRKDNRASNLRLTNKSENAQNRGKKQNCSSNYLGVFCVGKKWRAQINISKKRVSLGRFEHEKDAAQAYNTAAIKHYGSAAQINIL